MRREYRELLMTEPLTPEEIEANRKAKLDIERTKLLYNYDDSSDEDESLDYEKVPRARVEDVREDLKFNRLAKYFAIEKLKEDLLKEDKQGFRERLDELQQEKEKLEDKMHEAKELLSNNPSYVMEIEGRKAIYQHLPEYRQKKFEALRGVDLEIKSAKDYNSILVDAMSSIGIITTDKFNKWRDDQKDIASLDNIAGDNAKSPFIEMLKIDDSELFTEENKFSFLRKFLRQTNREVVDDVLKDGISSFARALGALKDDHNYGPLKNVTDDQLKSLSQFFVNKLPVVRRPTLQRTRVNPDIKSVSDFYAEELLRYRSLTRSSRELEGKGLDIGQTLVFESEKDLVSQKKQSVSKDKREDKAKDRFAHRGTVEEEVLNLGNYRNVLDRFKTIGLSDKSIAIVIREVFKNGSKEAFDSQKSDSGKKLSEFLSPEKKQIVVDAVELLFGTEGFRSPSSVVETNMMLDLIIEDPAHWSFEKAFVGKVIPGKKAGEFLENGGALSYTMKTMGSTKKTNAHSGGIPCGRKLSQNLDEILKEPSLRVHKYGGPSKTRQEDFTEYKKRKEDIAKSWTEKFKPAGEIDLASAIKRSSSKWYRS